MWHTVGNTPAEEKKNMVKEVSKKGFRKAVIENSQLSVVEFTTDWSGACHIIEPIYRDLAQSYNGVVNFFIVNVENEIGIDTEYGIMEIPTILFFRSGKVIDHAVGLTSKNVLISKIENAIGSGIN